MLSMLCICALCMRSSEWHWHTLCGSSTLMDAKQMHVAWSCASFREAMKIQWQIGVWREAKMSVGWLVVVLQIYVVTDTTPFLPQHFSFFLYFASLFLFCSLLNTQRVLLLLLFFVSSPLANCQCTCNLLKIDTQANMFFAMPYNSHKHTFGRGRQ